MTETAAEELRGQVVCTIKRAKLMKSNISKEERIAKQTVKKDNSIIILPADKGRAAVIINTTEYRVKMTDMVGDTKLSKDATHKYKNRMINILRKWKRKWIHLRQTVLEAIPRVGRTPKIVWDT